MRDRRYEQGGVVSFVIIAVILVALLGAGIWWAKKTQVSTANPSGAGSNPISSHTTPSGSTTPQTGNGKTNEPSNTGATSQSTSSTNSSTNSSDSGTDPSASSTSNVAATGPSVSEVPSTGPSEVFVTGMVLSIGSALACYALQSRRRVRSAALK